MKPNNEKGMTLVEILAALVILGIVFVSFMMIFPQMTNFNHRTEAKLETMNLAKTELVALRDISYRNSTFINQNKISSDLAKDVYQYQKNGYTVRVAFSKKDELNGVNVVKPYIALYKINIKIKDDSNYISETFGYIQIESK